MDNNSGDTARKVLRAVAAAAGFVGALFGTGGVGAALAGDKYLTDGTLIAAAAILTAIAVVALGIAWWRPILASLAMLLTIAGYWYVITGSWGSFWSAYQTAMNTSGVAENQFWSSGVLAVPCLAIATPFLAIGCVIALFGHDWSPGPSRIRRQPPDAYGRGVWRSGTASTPFSPPRRLERHRRLMITKTWVEAIVNRQVG